MPRRLLRILLILLFVPPIMATVMGWLVAPSFLHPVRRPLAPGLIREAGASFAHSRAQREDFNVTARAQRFLGAAFSRRGRQPHGRNQPIRDSAARGIQRGDDGSAGSWRKR